MLSLEDILLYFPVVCYGLLVMFTSVCYAVWNLICQHVKDLAYQTLYALCWPFRAMYAVSVELCCEVNDYCLKRLRCACNTITGPFVCITKDLNEAVLASSFFPPPFKALCTSLVTLATVILAVPERLQNSLKMKVSQMFNSWADFFLSAPAGIKSFLLDMCTQFKKAALQLLWDLTPDGFKIAYIWLLTTWYGTAKMASYNSQVLLLLLFCTPFLFWQHKLSTLALLASSHTTTSMLEAVLRPSTASFAVAAALTAVADNLK